ncbi:DedA family protein [Paraburkholderia sp. EG287A]|uniref:DedA family protein n=1 Tax=unclassified Paraburkholderia TaxID=2615204 RepID=UPI0034D17D4E
MLSYALVERFGILIVFLSVFGSSLGLPLAAAPTLIMIGANILRATGGVSSTLMHLVEVMGAAVIGGVLGDFVWFQCGKRYGIHSFYAVCNLLMARQMPIAYIERFFGRWGVRILIIARFVPGLSFLLMPLCGALAVRLRVFILHDVAGLVVWASMALATGALFASRIERTVALVLRFCCAMSRWAAGE